MDLKAQYKQIKKEIDLVIKDVLESGQYIKGSYLKKFEKEFAKYNKANFSVGVNSGTDALLLALMASGVGKGDEVITTPFTFIATVEAIVRCGATPVFVDIGKTYTIDTDKIYEKINKKTKAIIPVHIYGQMANMYRLYQNIKGSKRYKIAIIEDSCQSIGAKNHNAQFYQMACFSFFPAKNLGCYGDGGAVVTDSAVMNDTIRSLREHGFYKKYYFDKIGINSRLDEIQAAVLSVKLKYIDKWNKKRIELAEKYDIELTGYVKIPKVDNYNNHVYHQYVIRARNRNKLMKYLKKYNIETRVVYPVPCHLQKCFKYLGYKKGDFPIAEKASDRILSLPIDPEMKNQEYIIERIKKFYKC